MELIAPDGRKITEGSLGGVTKDWMRPIFSMTTMETQAEAKLNLIVTGAGVLDVDMSCQANHIWLSPVS